MARIKGVNTTPELLLRKELSRRGLRYRLQLRIEGIRVDISVPAKKLAVFIDGCFWHGCPDHYVHPRRNSAFWDETLRENVERDRRQTLKLMCSGWVVVRVWEHELRESIEEAAQRVLQGDVPPFQPRVIAVEEIAGGSMERRHMEDLIDEQRRSEKTRARTTKKLGRI